MGRHNNAFLGLGDFGGILSKSYTKINPFESWCHLRIKSAPFLRI